MILFRIDEIPGLFCDITGGQEKYGYDSANVGWMPIESMNFGFNDSTKKGGKAGGPAATQHGQPAGRTGTSGGTGAATTQATPAAGEKEEAFQGINISRFVDSASIQLMMLAMKDRKEDEKNGTRKADFHFLHSVMGAKEKDERFIFPYMMITLENVLVKSWNITASGDDRPTESLSLWYDKAAMRYYRTIDGKVWTGGQVSGWNQHDNVPWPETEITNKYFVEPKK